MPSHRSVHDDSAFGSLVWNGRDDDKCFYLCISTTSSAEKGVKSQTSSASSVLDDYADDNTVLVGMRLQSSARAFRGFMGNYAHGKV